MTEKKGEINIYPDIYNTILKYINLTGYNSFGMCVNRYYSYNTVEEYMSFEEFKLLLNFLRQILNDVDLKEIEFYDIGLIFFDKKKDHILLSVLASLSHISINLYEFFCPKLIYINCGTTYTCIDGIKKISIDFFIKQQLENMLVKKIKKQQIN